MNAAQRTKLPTHEIWRHIRETALVLPSFDLPTLLLLSIPFAEGAGLDCVGCGGKEFLIR